MLRYGGIFTVGYLICLMRECWSQRLHAQGCQGFYMNYISIELSDRPLRHGEAQPIGDRRSACISTDVG
jgi:hypothetical protein